MSLVRPAGLPRRLAALALAGCLLLAGCQRQDAPGGETPESATAETATAEAADPDASASAEAEAVIAQTGAVLAETPDAGRSYVDETLFIGDSNTARYMMYADETGEAFTTLANNIGVVSMGAGSITTLKCEQFVGYSQMYTIPDAVAMLKPRRIIIGFGTNNLSGQSTNADSFIETYLKGLEAIREAWPYADIIVNAIPPLDKQRENQNLYMVQVDAYNAALAEMCEENGFKFLNSAEVLKDPDTGWAKKDYTLSDGVHLSKTAVTAFFEYVRTHAYVTEDRRPQPLGNIPEPAGTPVGLISQDPIAVRGAKVPVEFVASTGGTLQGATSQLVKKGGTCSTVTAVPNAGWKFAGWTASLGTAGSSASLTFTVPSNADAGGVVLTALFTPDEHEHDWVEIAGTRQEPTCLYGGYAQYQCSICGAYGEADLDPLGHAWDEGAVTAEPQPGVEGQRTYTCTRCGEKKTEAIAALPVATPTPEPTPTPHTHQYAETERVEPTCGAAGHVTMKCSCGASYTEELPATGQHTWGEGVVTKAPSVDAPGEMTYTCTVCGATRTEEIPALEPPVDPAPPETAAPSAPPAGGAAADGQTADPSGPAS